jgi:hypothetical protein
VEKGLFEPVESQVEVVRNVLKDDWVGLLDVSSEQGLEPGADQGQSTCCGWIAYETFVLSPVAVAFPVAGFAAPMRANDSCQSCVARLIHAKAADEMANNR